MADKKLADRYQAARDILIMEGIDPDKVIPSIGFTSATEIAQASQEKRISLGANYHSGTWEAFASASEKRIGSILAVTSWFLAVLLTILSISQGNKLYVFAAISVLLANSMAKRFAEIGNAIGGIGLMTAALFAFKGHWDWVGIIVAIAIAAFCGRARIMWYSEIIVARALLNDSLFAMLFVKDGINVRDNSTGKRIYYKS
ncbi:MAG: hypothetical protein ACRYG7_18420 [Janthinobacterium lividum]